MSVSICLGLSTVSGLLQVHVRWNVCACVCLCEQLMGFEERLQRSI